MLATDLLVAGRNLLQHRRRNLFLGAAIAAVASRLQAGTKYGSAATRAAYSTMSRAAQR